MISRCWRSQTVRQFFSVAFFFFRCAFPGQMRGDAQLPFASLYGAFEVTISSYSRTGASSFSAFHAIFAQPISRDTKHVHVLARRGWLAGHVCYACEQPSPLLRWNSTVLVRRAGWWPVHIVPVQDAFFRVQLIDQRLKKRPISTYFAPGNPRTTRTAQ